ncbi:UPF0764 protein C16orf89 homolog [Babylonia areolata]|uniref:UPF0764 protein C16orf89 homolog n=1 Tax=Babylonia areolata TaxID=304850 RepID=UPI003FD3DE89
MARISSNNNFGTTPPPMSRSCWFRPLVLILLCTLLFLTQSARPARASLSALPSPGSAEVATTTTTTATATTTLNTTLGYLRRTLHALKGAMDFFHRHFDEVNLDAVIGTRIVEGSLKVLLANLQRKRVTGVLPDDVVTHIRAIYHVAKRVSDDAEPHVYESEPRYYQRIGPAIREGLWEVNYTRRTLPSFSSPSTSVPMWSYRPVEAMSELESDDCLTELFGTSGGTKEKCVISETCWNRMTTFGYSRYSLSHEIFYLQIAEQSGCLPQIVWRIAVHGQPGLRQLQDTFCANMLREALTIAGGGYPGSEQDLFMEQATLCGMYGYWEFFRYPWLETILGWQDGRQGCYRWAGWPRERIGGPHHITKREERRLDNGCLCHRTTVAAGALVQYVRYLVEEYVAEVSANISEAN